MKRKSLLISLAFVLSFGLSAHAQYTSLTATKIQSVSGALLPSGQMCLTPVSTTTGQPTAFNVGGGNGQVLASQVCFPVTDGSIGSGVTVADTEQATPSIGFIVRILDPQGVQISTLSTYIRPTGTTWDLDSWVPTESIPVLPIAVSSGTSAPVGQCTAPSIYYENQTIMYGCVAGAWVQLITGANGATGATGAPGAAATVTVGTVTTGAPGSDALVTNSGSDAAAVLDFTVPQGLQGETGPQGATGPQGETGATGAQGPQGEAGATGAQGPAGADGTSFSWLGAWSSSTAYVANDVVSDGGSSYIAIASSTDQEPPNATYWSLVAAQGSTGATGAQGPQGDTGATGAQGDPGPTIYPAAGIPCSTGSAWCDSSYSLSTFLQAANNLSDLASASTARTNLGLGSAATQASSAFDAAGAASAVQSASLQKANNLSDVADAATALANLGAQAALGYTPLNAADNLSDVANAATALSNLGAQAALGYTPLNPANNLSDVGNAATARSNLGLGTAATEASTAFDTSGAAAAAEAASDPSGSAAAAQAVAEAYSSDASNLSSGTVPVAQLPVATSSTFGVLRPDGTTITIDDGVISAVGGSGMVYPGAGIPCSTGSAWCDSYPLSTFLQAANNLSDVADAATALSNLGAQAALGYTPLNKADNLSDLSSASTARTNLGLGTAATQASSAFDAAGDAATAVTTAEAASLQRSNNLSDVADAATALANLGAQAALGYTPLKPSNNLSDVSSAATARTNLGLGTAATQATTAFDASGAASSAQSAAETYAQSVNTSGTAGNGTFTHTLSGATPTITVSSTTVPATDQNYLLLSANVTSFSLPASTAVANGEVVRLTIQQGATTAYTLPTGSASSPFTAGSGTTLVNSVPGGCPTIGTVTSSTAPSELFVVMAYHSALTEWEILGCQSNSPTAGAPWQPLTAVGTFGTYAVGTPIVIANPNTSGQFSTLSVVTTKSGTCTTPPTFNIYDGASFTGTALTASATSQTYGNASSAAETLTYVAGDNVGIYISSAGASCASSIFAVSLQ